MGSQALINTAGVTRFETDISGPACAFGASITEDIGCPGIKLGMQVWAPLPGHMHLDFLVCSVNRVRRRRRSWSAIGVGPHGSAIKPFRVWAEEAGPPNVIPKASFSVHH